MPALGAFALAVSSAAVLTVTAAGPALGLAGDLDRSWATGGRATVNIDDCSESPAIIATQSDGDVIVASETCEPTDGESSDIVVARVTSTGVADTPGFAGPEGRIRLDLGGQDVVMDVKVLADDAIVVAGVAFPDSPLDPSVVVLVKLSPEGVPDNTFGPGGRRDVEVGDIGYPITVLPLADGDLLVAAGSFVPGSEDEDLVFLRFDDVNGLDAEFGTGGMVRHEIAAPGPATLDAEGRILVTGMLALTPASPRLALQRFTADGQFDSTFGEGGVVLTAAGTAVRGTSVLVAHDSTILVGAMSYNVDPGTGDETYLSFVARYSPAGQILNYPVGVEPDPYSASPAVWTVLRGPDGRYLAVGGGQVVRFSLVGTADRFFGENGISRLSTGDGFAYGANAVLDAAGGLLVGVNITQSEGDEDTGVLRIQLDTPHPPRFISRSPLRFYDSRSVNDPLEPGETRTLRVTGVPTTGVSSIVVNVTAVTPTSSGYLTLFPAEVFRPLASTVNFSPGRTTANHATVRISPSSTGELQVFNSAGTTHVLLDVAGYYTDGTEAVAGSRFVPVSPQRILDSRPGRLSGDGREHPLGSGQQLSLAVLGRGGVPVTGVTAIVLNVTAVTPTGSGYLTVWPHGGPRPTASNVNFPARTTVPNLVTVQVGQGGLVDIFNSNGFSHVLADVAGYFTSEEGRSGEFWPISPRRLLDTRPDAAIQAGAAREVFVVNQARIPASGVAAIVLNVTITAPTSGGFLSVYPAGVARPTVSNLNFVKGQTVANQVIVPMGYRGKIMLFNSAGATHVVLDVAGWVSA